jgi:hypothetical protein
VIGAVSAVHVIEFVLAGAFTLGGVRSFLIWVRRPIDSDHVRDQLSYALYRTGRIGLWFAVAGIFLISGLIRTEGRAFDEEFAQHRWFLMVPLLLAIMQFVGAYLLGRSVEKRPQKLRGGSSPPDPE